MSSKWLVVFSVLVSIGALYLYKHRDKVVDNKSTMDARFDYWANDIQAVKTDDVGKVALTLHAKSLSHELLTNTLTLDHVSASQVIHQQSNNTDNNDSVVAKETKITFKAKKALWLQNKDMLTLQDDVNIRRVQFIEADLTKTHQFSGKNLQYNTKTKQLNSQSPILFSADNSYIKAQSMTADLKTGLFEFNSLQAAYQK